MDFRMPLLPTVENTQPKGQKLANELENELDVRSVHLKIGEDNFKFRINQSHQKFKKHKHLGSQHIRFLKYHLTLIQRRTLCWKKRDFGWQLDVYGV
ncbi:hypothetical protein T07_13133 [Trichinella nelsoni]|uniref:Uncharacterized protein n=1 Tax=Trichinella nelsoni TaxID=6336 RepID=A0A0V0RVH4_9BILA|nr:hypothetical protein T07_13133 [Trichinella nelsoni]